MHWGSVPPLRQGKAYQHLEQRVNVCVVYSYGGLTFGLIQGTRQELEDTAHPADILYNPTSDKDGASVDS